MVFTASHAIAEIEPAAASPTPAPDVSRQNPPDPLDPETIVFTPLEERAASWAKLSPVDREAVIEKFRQLPASGPSNAKINALFKARGQVDATAAIESALGFSTPETRMVALEAMVFGLKSEAAGAVVHAMTGLAENALEPGAKERLLGLTIVKWSQVDPSAAAQFLTELYPHAAERLAKPGPQDGVLLTTTKGVAGNWGALAPEAALEFYQKGGPPENKTALQFVIIGWWRKDPVAAAEYVGAHLATPVQREIAGEMAAVMAGQDPAVAARWAPWIKDRRVRERTELQIAPLWAQHDPKAAAAWAAGLSSKSRESAITIVAGNWTSSDSPAALSWVRSLNGNTRDAAVTGYAAAISRKDGAAGLESAAKIKNRDMREKLTKAIATEWLDREPDEARLWIQKSALSETERKELLDE